ncbi:ATP-sensitive potassium transporter [Acetobacter pasteurianus NBRC 101655]|uniref:ATP-sensitive potassium transporter n=4 Tax=Acetobacter pasteurianus TaxID=438 RepID=C7JFL4_ACEP3|nr:ion channel [Acetobacter pasteurianus]BAU37915.1 ATP-sensitive potassium transporter [Acetobacter pasteurianus NBRC 101655]QHM90754.1 ion channel [Acetobacter pasteurianus]BAH99035.1 ATP-sensitive potassium transporter [Acetobacter pasteurianus IFO 3283-01]BAI02086.1 ATP-sensitive potassium transporter [Acetobacter pasteurianus IFO 3283-03]BAI05134.1 ATP-sensitive potassium transporter [Acetobacter pasteurianus IFO 3283-07]
MRGAVIMKRLLRRYRKKSQLDKEIRHTPLEDVGGSSTAQKKKEGGRFSLSTREAAKRFRAHALVEEKGHHDVVRVGLKDSVWTDLYHHALTASWPAFTAVAVFSYLLINFIFALLYMVAPDQITSDGQHTLLSLFFFSVQTLSTVGYGGMTPVGIYANAIVSLEVFIGMMLTAVATGLLFARFARPRARIMFSNTAVVSSESGIPALCIRIANLRVSVILSVDVEVALSRLVMGENGHLVRKFDQLLLVQSHVPVLRFAFVMAHVIGPDSPLHGKTMAELEAEEAEIIVTVTGTDEALGQTVFARTAYRFDRVRNNHRFVDIVVSRPDGRIAVDYTRFHDVEQH